MNAGIGKKFEERFKIDWKRCFPNTFVYRLKDQMTGQKETSANPCDFLAFNNNVLWMIECKETSTGTINFSKMPQIDRLPDYRGLDRVARYFVIWFSKFDVVVAVQADEALRIREDGNKSIGVKMLKEKKYNILELPSEKLRKFMQTDYNYLLENVILG